MAKAQGSHPRYAGSIPVLPTNVPATTLRDMPQQLPDPQLVDAVIAAIRGRHQLPGHPYPYEILADRYATETVMAMMEQLDEAEILDYGVSLRTAWVVDYDGDIEARIAAFKAGQEYEPSI